MMHLFLEQSDAEMAKLCQEILSKTPEGDLTLLRQEIKRVFLLFIYSKIRTKTKGYSLAETCIGISE